MLFRSTKVSLETAKIWSAILTALPDSRLMLKSRNFSDKATCRYAMAMFEQHGIDDKRIELIALTPSFREHLNMYNRIDIALDTFPYNGTTTTCEALWMGVPVVSLSGETHASRVGMSILRNIGLADFIARTDEDYIKIAVTAATDIAALNLLRENLREKMTHSPLCDKELFVKNLEDTYRQVWAKWCKTY